MSLSEKFLNVVASTTERSTFVTKVADGILSRILKQDVAAADGWCWTDYDSGCGYAPCAWHSLGARMKRWCCLDHNYNVVCSDYYCEAC